MIRLLVVTTALIMASVTFAGAADTVTPPLRDQVIVDRTTRDKNINDYVLLTRTAIQRVWTTPLNLEVPGPVKGRVQINYTLSRSGALRSLDLVGSSGNEELDKSLLQAIRSAAPFPPFPDEITARSMVVRANFIVADLPAVKPTTVQHSVSKGVPPEVSGSVEPGGEKRPTWGLPAGTAQQPDPDEAKEIPAPPPAKKYKWGL